MNKPISIQPDFFWLGALDFDLRIFDIVMETQFGTSYNSYLLKTDSHTVLFETVKESFFDTFLDKLKCLCVPSDIDYIVINHTEPDHAGSLNLLLEYAPHATVICSVVALKYLTQIINRPFKHHVVKDQETLQLGNRTLRFILAPFLHWPDTMYTYIEEDHILVTCDSFGAHYANPILLRSHLEENHANNYLSAYKYYFDMIMGPFKPYVLKALHKIENLPLDFICPGHGLILDASQIPHHLALYKTWSLPVVRSKPSVVIAYVSAYGYTESLAWQIAQGLQSARKDIDVHLFDLVSTPLERVLTEVEHCCGLIIGSPTILSDTLPPIWQLLTSLNPTVHKGKKATAFGSYGWSGEAVDFIVERLEQLKMNMIVPPLKILFKPNSDNLAEAFKLGESFGENL
ncbi:MAG: FprA family A-type flavoprotein [Niameybacter sp.]